MDVRIAAMIRRAAEQFMTETCLIQRRVQRVNEVGAGVEEFEDTATVQCRLITETQDARGNAEKIAGRETLTDSYRLIVPAGTVIADDYRVTMGTKVFEVIGILDARTDESDVQVRLRRMR